MRTLLVARAPCRAARFHARAGRGRRAQFLEEREGLVVVVVVLLAEEALAPPPSLPPPPPRAASALAIARRPPLPGELRAAPRGARARAPHAQRRADAGAGSTRKEEKEPARLPRPQLSLTPPPPKKTKKQQALTCAMRQPRAARLAMLLAAFLATLVGAARAQGSYGGGYGAYGGAYGGGGYGGYGAAAGAPAMAARRRLAAAPDSSLWAMGASGRALQQLLQAPTAALPARRRGRSLMQTEGEEAMAAGAYGGGYGGAYGGGSYGGYGAYAAGTFAAGDEASIDAFAGAGRRRALRRRG
jgi:hypothetical protein